MKYHGVKKEKRNFKEEYKYAFQEFLESELEYQKDKGKKRLRIIILISVCVFIYMLFKFL